MVLATVSTITDSVVAGRNTRPRQLADTLETHSGIQRTATGQGPRDRTHESEAQFPSKAHAGGRSTTFGKAHKIMLSILVRAGSLRSPRSPQHSPQKISGSHIPEPPLRCPWRFDLHVESGISPGEVCTLAAAPKENAEKEPLDFPNAGGSRGACWGESWTKILAQVFESDIFCAN